ncbi:MAG: prepilin-type N-terminal cleavage/methylation domain-containing protein [Planctomycetota bacterium]
MKNSGFTLIELLIVIGIIGLLIGVALPTYTSFQDRAKVTMCQKNLQEIGNSLELYKQDHGGKWPVLEGRDGKKERMSGFQLVLAPWHFKTITQDEKYAKLYICPGAAADQDNFGGQAYEEIEDIDPTTISYAGRDMSQFPVNRNDPIKDALVADSNYMLSNHRSKTNVLWGDCRTVTNFDIGDYESAGENLVVGPDSPVEALREFVSPDEGF